MRITHAGQVRCEDFNVNLFTAAQRHRKACVVIAIKETKRCGFHRNNQNGDGARCQLPQCRRALLLHIWMRREIFKRQHIVRRQPHHALRINSPGQLAAGLQQRLQRLGGLIIRHNDDHGLPRGLCHQGTVECARCSGEPGDTTTPRAEAQMPLHAFKCGRMLQIREDFADERENHAL